MLSPGFRAGLSPPNRLRRGESGRSLIKPVLPSLSLEHQRRDQVTHSNDWNFTTMNQQEG